MIGKKKTLTNIRASLLPFSNDAKEAVDDVLAESEIPMDLPPITSPKNERKSFGGGNRRRSSLGLSARTPLSEAEQLRIASMYKLVIQMSSENKINDKNSWNYDLIDHMRNVIRDDNKGVNFQKASCTLDASVKIYSHRVDDTYNASYRILENLSRNQNGRGTVSNDDGENGADDEEGNENPSNQKQKRGGRGRTYFANTLGSSEDQFNMEKVENDENFDPMFQKITKSFDEGGAKGLLLYNLKLSSKNCSLLFDESVLPQINSSEGVGGRLEGLKNNTFPAVNMRDLVHRSKITSESIQSLEVCSTLKQFRATLKINSSEGRLNLTNKLKDMQTPRVVQQCAPFSSSVPFAETNTATDAVDQSSFMDVDCWGEVNDDYAPPADMTVEETGEIVIPINSMQGDHAVTDDVFPSCGKLQWAVNDEDREKLAAEDSMTNRTSSDKSSFDIALDTLDDGNAWAGASHWKYGRTRAKQLQLQLSTTSENKLNADSESVISSSVSSAAAVEPATKKGKTSKAGIGATFVLTPTYVDESKFGQLKKQDTTIQTQKALTKQSEEADSTILPIDQKLQVRDLARLFLLPNYLSSKNKGMLGGSSRTSSQKEKFMMLYERFERDEKVLSQGPGDNVVNAYAEKRTEERDAILTDTFSGDNYDNDDYGAGGGDYYPETDENPVASSQPMMTEPMIQAPVRDGLQIAEEKLLQCDRKVAKIDVKYAKTSKKVNVHKLKADIWSGLQETLSPAQSQIKTNQSPEPRDNNSNAVTFQHLIDHVSEHQEQNEASLQYYFICLLHLANEKGLRIEGQEDLSDLKIRIEKS